MKTSILILSIIISGCVAQRHTNIDQGVKGFVLEVKGNQMPGKNKSVSPGEPVSCMVYAFPLQKLNEVTVTDNVFYEFMASPVDSSQSKKDGSYALRLPAGDYSIVIKEKGQYYANSFDGDGNINPVQISQNEIVELNILINYMAEY